MFDLSRLGAWANLPFFKSELDQISAKISAETVAIFPPNNLTFAALEKTQPDDCKVVILGQDPYHTAGKADGLAFSIPQRFGGRLDSLGNIIKELQTDIHVTRTQTDLSDWAEKGVLLLNTALTVPEGKAKGHARLGWDALTIQIINHLSDRPRAFILWGAHAQGFAPIDPQHLVLIAPHPSPLSVHKGFFGSRPFSTVNQWLIDQDQEAIDWADP